MNVLTDGPFGEYCEALRAYHLAAAEWLGMNADQVFRFALSEGDDGHPRATWEASAKQEPRVGYVTHGARGDDEGITFTGEVVLDYLDGLALNTAIGPYPTPPWAGKIPAHWISVWNLRGEDCVEGRTARWVDGSGDGGILTFGKRIPHTCTTSKRRAVAADFAGSPTIL